MQGELIYNAPKAVTDRASRFYGWQMMASTLKICSTYLLHLFASRRLPVEVVDDYLKTFGTRLLRLSHTSLWASGREHIDPKKSYVFMSNHASMMDIPVAFVAIPNSLRMITKEELFRIPIFGKTLERSGFIPIDRKNKFKAIHQLERAKERLKNGISIWVAPEGTRSRSKELQPFKKGGFHVAKALNVPILPVWIEGSGDVVPPGSTCVQPNRTIRVFFGESIETNQFDDNQIPELMNVVQIRMNQLRVLANGSANERTGG